MSVSMPEEDKSGNAHCRYCGHKLKHTFVDLGMSPLCERYVSFKDKNKMEPFYPLHAYVCEACFLVQLEEYVKPEDIFTEYAYFSSYSESWVEHARQYAEMAIDRFKLDRNSFVMEIASNDGYLLQHFVKRDIPVLGIEPAANVAQAAREKGVPTLVEFFKENLAQELAAKNTRADLIVGNNVLAQVPDLNDFIKGLKVALKPEGIITLEFPHLLRLIEENQFDTIYHEHFSYFSLTTVERIFRSHNLAIFDVEELPTHGGSLRIYACHGENDRAEMTEKVALIKEAEKSAGLEALPCYLSFQERVKEAKLKILEFLIKAKRRGKSVAGYGAPGKGNTLLNYCGIRTDFIDYVVDRNPYKQGKFLPGTHIPIYAPEKISETRPDVVVIMPWNFRDEIMKQMSFIRRWGARFAVFIPSVTVYD
jgi:SAM-dependent methyltransferase